MKKSMLFFLIILTASISMNSCEKSNVISNSSLNLQSPNKIVIASSVEDLKSILISSIAKKFNSEVDFKITKISYLDVEKGAVADIEYLTTTGVESNVIIMQDCNTEFTCSAKHVEGLITNKNTRARAIVFSCSGVPCCRVHARINTDGTLNYDCSCGDCSMTVQF